MKNLIILSLLLISGFIASAQGGHTLFSKLDKPLPRTISNKAGLKLTSVTSTDSTFFKFRPGVSVMAIEIPSMKVMSGVGIYWENITYTYSTQKFYVNFSIAGVAWAGSQLNPEVNNVAFPTNTISYGLMLNFLNNNLGAGGSYDGHRVNLVVHATWNPFNN